MHCISHFDSQYFESCASFYSVNEVDTGVGQKYFTGLANYIGGTMHMFDFFNCT